MTPRWLALVASSVVLLGACGGSDAPVTTTTSAPPARLSVVATTSQVGDFARTIGGDLIDVAVVGKPDESPHTHTATATDITALATAKVILKNGAGLEDWLDAAIDESEARGSIVDTSDGVQIRKASVGGQLVEDPHIWMSVVNARIMVSNVTRALVDADPTNAVAYQGNERAYSSQLDSLSRDIRQSISRLNATVLVTTHDCFGYFDEEFGLVNGGSLTLGLENPKPLDAAQSQALADAMKAKNVKVVFGDSLIARTSLQTAMAAEGGATLLGGEDALYCDALGSPSSDADTYLKMMRRNAASIGNNLN